MTTYYGVCACGAARPCSSTCPTCQSNAQLAAAFPGGYPGAPGVMPLPETWICHRCKAINVSDSNSACETCNGEIT